MLSDSENLCSSVLSVLGGPRLCLGMGITCTTQSRTAEVMHGKCTIDYMPSNMSSVLEKKQSVN